MDNGTLTLTPEVIDSFSKTFKPLNKEIVPEKLHSEIANYLRKSWSGKTVKVHEIRNLIQEKFVFLRVELTREKINEIVSVIEFVNEKNEPTGPNAAYVRSRTAETSNHTAQQIRNHLIKQMLGKMVHPRIIDKLKEHIKAKFLRSRIEPGATTGVHAAESASAIVTQDLLKTFHFSGQIVAETTGVEKMEELISATQNPKIVNTIVHFKVEPTFDDIMDNLSYFLDIRLAQLVEDYEFVLYSKKEYEEEKWTIRCSELMTDETTRRIAEPSDEISRWRLRLKMNIYQMYKHRITMKDVVDVLEKEESSSPFHCVFSPFHLGLIDVIIDKKSIDDIQSMNKKEEDDVVMEKYKKVLVDQLSEITVTRWRGIRRLIANYHSIMTFVNRAEKLSFSTLHRFEKRASELPSSPAYFNFQGKTYLLNDGEEASTRLGKSSIEEKTINAFRIHVFSDNLSITPITLDRIGKLFEICGMSYRVCKTKNTLDETVEALFIYTDETNPIGVVNEKIDNETTRCRTDRLPISESPILTTSRYYHIVTENFRNTKSKANPYKVLQNLYSMNIVDPRYTYTNNPHDIFRFYGICGAFNFYCYELNRNMGEKVNHRHPLQLAGQICRRGRLLGINFSGATKDIGEYFEENDEDGSGDEAPDDNFDDQISVDESDNDEDEDEKSGSDDDESGNDDDGEGEKDVRDEDKTVRRGAFGEATFERAFERFAMGAAFGNESSTRDISVRMIMGGLNRFGTAYDPTEDVKKGVNEVLEREESDFGSDFEEEVEQEEEEKVSLFKKPSGSKISLSVNRPDIKIGDEDADIVIKPKKRLDPITGKRK